MAKHKGGTLGLVCTRFKRVRIKGGKVVKRCANFMKKRGKRGKRS